MLADCCPVCSTQIAPLSIPGPPGPTGAAGTNGTNGTPAITTTTAQVGPTPADTTTTYNVSVASSIMFTVGENLIIGQGPGLALANPGPLAVVITAIPSVNNLTVKNLRTVDQGVTVSSGAQVTPIGFLPAVPITVGQGGTGSTTKAGAQTSLGLGQGSLISSAATGLAQTILAGGPAQVGTIDIQITAVGTYEIRGMVSVDFNGVTFAASRQISAKIRNVTQGTLLATGVINTQTVTTLSFPTCQIHTPPIKYSAANLNDHLQLTIEINVVNTAGTLSADAGSLEAIPLSLS